MKDVAKRAGVATSTVSRVINDHASISDATKEKVFRVMEEMGYVPNIAARNLGKRSSGAVGVILPPMDSRERMGNPFYLEIIEAINDEARSHHMTTAIATAKSFDTLLDNVQLMHRQKQVDGFILLYSDKDDPVIAYLSENNVPFSLIGQPYTNEDNVIYVDNDNQLLGKHATDYLIENGHENILFITNITNENVYYERYFGYQKAMMLSGLTVHPSVDMESPEDYLAFEQVLKETQATAAVVLDDIFAIRMIQLIQMYGYHVPDDFSVISFNNSVYSTLVHPYLTSIDIDVTELGKMGMRNLNEFLQKKETTGVRMVIPHKLIKRETVLRLSE